MFLHLVQGFRRPDPERLVAIAGRLVSIGLDFQGNRSRFVEIVNLILWNFPPYSGKQEYVAIAIEYPLHQGELPLVPPGQESLADLHTTTVAAPGDPYGRCDPPFGNAA